MSRPVEILRQEILEERGNRDAFHALLIVSALFALFLVVLGIAAWNTRIAFMPLVPKAPAAAPAHVSFFAPRTHTARRNPPPGVRKTPEVVTPASDAASTMGQSCRAEENFPTHV